MGLLKKVKVSGVRPVPCKLSGKVIGRGIPGYLFSEDFVMQDKTGIIYLDYRSPFAIWEFFFAILRRGNWDGAEVEVEGWYRRSPSPYIEISTLRSGDETIKSYVPLLNLVSAIVLILVGLILL